MPRADYPSCLGDPRGSYIVLLNWECGIPSRFLRTPHSVLLIPQWTLTFEKKSDSDSPSAFPVAFSAMRYLARIQLCEQNGKNKFNFYKS